MGRYDTSRTRVIPVFDALLARDPAGQSWLPTLLAPPGGWGQRPQSRRTCPELAHRLGMGHAGTVAPITTESAPLAHPAGRPSARRGDQGYGRDTGETRARRDALLRRGPATVAEALARLSRPQFPARAWYIREGPSEPNVYLETPDLLVVIEGKCTEAGPMTHTTWMPGRHQMLRHLDAA